MHIELYKNPNHPIEMPFINGVLQKNFAEFLIVRYRWPSKIRENMKSANPLTMHHIASDIRMFLENFSSRHPSVSIQDANYEDHISDVLSELSYQGEWTNDTYNIRYGRVRDYFDFLANKGIALKAIFPAKVVANRANDNLDSDFLSHTKSGKIRYVQDKGNKRVSKKSDYADRVLSLNECAELYSVLKDDDPVYATIMKTMMLTTLRVSNVSQMPFRKSDLNKGWMLWPQFKRTGRAYITFNFVAKGRKPASISIRHAVLQTIYEEYINPHYSERKEKYDDKYSNRKNKILKEGSVDLPEDILWLNKNGTPIKPSFIQKAFARASVILGRTIEPHFMRHTGATHLLYNLCKAMGIEPTEKNAEVLHHVLKDILCHENVSTTRRYLRTILNKKATLFIPHIEDGLRNFTEAQMEPAVVNATKETLDAFYGETAEELVSEKHL